MNAGGSQFEGENIGFQVLYLSGTLMEITSLLGMYEQIVSLLSNVSIPCDELAAVDPSN